MCYIFYTYLLAALHMYTAGIDPQVQAQARVLAQAWAQDQDRARVLAQDQAQALAQVFRLPVLITPLRNLSSQTGLKRISTST